MSDDHCGHPHTAEKRSPIRLGRNLRFALVALAVIWLASLLPPLQPLNESINEYARLIWWAVALGLLIGGVIDHFVPDGFIQKLLGRDSAWSLLNAVVAGFVLSACSHGILAIAIQLYKKGARTASVITFLLASPWANLPITILLFGIFGWRALLFVGGAMLVALVTGLVYIALERAGLVETQSRSADDAPDYRWDAVQDFNLRQSVDGVVRGTVNLANMVLWWIIIGFLLAAVIRAWVPHQVFHDWFAADFPGLLMTLLVATIIEVCSEGSAPIAFELFDRLGELGNPFVFLMAGVVTDYTEIGLLWSNIGRRAAIWLPIVTVPQVLLLGTLFNYFW